MAILGVDWGEAKVGVAIAVGTLSEPLKVIRYKDLSTLLNELKGIIEKEKIERVVVGISEGKSRKKAQEFSKALKDALLIPVETYDETLSTYEAQRKAYESGIKRKKRKALEDAYAASVMLQSYLGSIS